MLTEERRNQILNRVAPLLRQIDPDLHLLEVLLDSTRTQLVFVLQKGEWPVVLGMDWLEYVSHRDPELLTCLEAGLRAREDAVQRRLEADQEV